MSLPGVGDHPDQERQDQRHGRPVDAASSWSGISSAAIPLARAGAGSSRSRRARAAPACPRARAIGNTDDRRLDRPAQGATRSAASPPIRPLRLPRPRYETRSAPHFGDARVHSPGRASGERGSDVDRLLTSSGAKSLAMAAVLACRVRSRRRTAPGARANRRPRAVAPPEGGLGAASCPAGRLRTRAGSPRARRRTSSTVRSAAVVSGRGFGALRRCRRGLLAGNAPDCRHAHRCSSPSDCGSAEPGEDGLVSPLPPEAAGSRGSG